MRAAAGNVCPLAQPLWKAYTKTLNEDLRYLATWMPDRHVSVGDVVIMQDDRSLERQTTLAALGINFETVSEVHTAPVFYVSKKGLSVGGSAAADAGDVLPATVEARVDFTREGATFFRLEGSREISVDNLHDVKQEMLHRAAKASWPEDWLLVTHVVEADRAVVLVSKSGNASATFAAEAALPGDVAGIATASARLDVISHSDMGLALPDAPNVTPLYHAVGVRRAGLTGGKRVRRTDRDGRLLPPTGSAEFQVVDVMYED